MSIQCEYIRHKHLDWTKLLITSKTLALPELFTEKGNGVMKAQRHRCFPSTLSLQDQQAAQIQIIQQRHTAHPSAPPMPFK